MMWAGKDVKNRLKAEGANKQVDGVSDIKTIELMTCGRRGRASEIV